ncbi:MAG: glycosyltransferase family 4 protein, partial [Acidiferrobacterales bacterium]
GGETVQQSLLAKEFASRGYQVSLVVPDTGQPDGKLIDKIKMWKTYRETAGIRVLRFFYPRITSTLRALRRADADVYYQSPAGMDTGLTAAFCQAKGRKFIHRIASDVNCIPGQQLIKYWRDRKIYEYGLKRANLVAAQSVKQANLLQKHYGLHSVTVNMAVELSQGDSTLERAIDVLWVNNLRQVKRPQLFLELATKLPGYRCVMIGGPCPGQNNYYQEISRQAETVENLEFLGAVPYGEVNRYFTQAKVFVNTSEVEGFPNSFLQAWVHGVPVVSFFDPDDLIAQKELGVAPAGLGEMAQAVEALLRNEQHRVDVGSRARTFALDNYSPSSVVSQYIELIESMERE